MGSLCVFLFLNTCIPFLAFLWMSVHGDKKNFHCRQLGGFLKEISMTNKHRENYCTKPVALILS